METKSKLQIERETVMEEAWKAYSKKKEMYDLYIAECQRGIMHTSGWDTLMEQYRNELPSLLKSYGVATNAWKETIPPYDPDNHTAGCGCVIKDGIRVYWCGDHF